MKVKLAFYPSPDVKKILKDVPQGKLSARVNALILKGSEKEKDELRSEWRKRAFAEYAESSPEDLFSD